MANEHLRAALQQAGLQPDDLAEIVQADVRTVRRWLAGRNPYPRQRAKVARALDTTEHHLWPDLATAAPSRPPTARASDLVAAYPTATDLAAPDWKVMMRDAADRIELLGDTLTPLLGTAGVPELLAAKADQNCEVRVLISDPGPQLAPLMNRDRIEIRILEVPAHQSIHRFDQQLLLTLHLLDEQANRAPLLHIRRAASGGLFDRLAGHYRDLWEQAAHPIEPDVDLHNDEEEREADVEPDAPRPASEQTTGIRTEPSATPPRRWPRRTA